MSFSDVPTVRSSRTAALALLVLVGCSVSADQDLPSRSPSDGPPGVGTAPPVEGVRPSPSPTTPTSVDPPVGASFRSERVPLSTTPVASSGWERESIHPIVWTSPIDDTIEVLAEASFDRGATYAEIGVVGSMARRYLWKIPSNGPAEGRVRLTFRRVDPNTGAITVLKQVETTDTKFAASRSKKYTWSRVANDAPFGPRDGAGGIVYGGKMWLVGGWNGDRFPLTTTNDVWSSPDGATWTQEKPNTFLNADTFDRTNDWEGRHFAGYLNYAGKMWIVGGDPVQGYYQTDVWNSTDGRRWTRTDIHTTTPRMVFNNNPLSPSYLQWYELPGFRPVQEAQFGLRTLHITGVFANKLWLMGGQRVDQFVDPNWPGAPAKVFDDVWNSADGATWTKVPTASPHWPARALVSGTAELGGRMWLIGGGTYDDFNRPDRELRNDVWSTADGARWEKVDEAMPFSPRQYHNVVAYDGRLWVINGYDGFDNVSDVWYSSDGRNWYEAHPPAGFVGRHAGTTWVFNGNLFVGSGNALDADPADVSGERAKWFADVWKLAPTP